MYFETSANIHGSDNNFVSFQRTDIIQNSKLPFYFNKFSLLTNISLKSMGRFRIQLILEDNTWSTLFNILKNDQYSKFSTDWTPVNL